MLGLPELSEMISDPIVQVGSLAVIGALVTRVALRNHPTRRLIGQVTFFVALTILLLYHGVVPYEVGPPEVSTLQRIFIGLAKVIWWTNAAWAADFCKDNGTAIRKVCAQFIALYVFGIRGR
jgi:hypothetical protein